MADPLYVALQIRIAKALAVAKNEGMTDGAHHKMWVIDQMVRVLLGCPEVEEEFIGMNSELLKRKKLGESLAYLNFVGQCEAWDMGEAP